MAISKLQILGYQKYVTHKNKSLIVFVALLNMLLQKLCLEKDIHRRQTGLALYFIVYLGFLTIWYADWSPSFLLHE